MSLEAQMTQYRFMRQYGEGLLADIDAEDAFRPVHENGHHPAWIIGHLATIGSRGIAMLGGQPPIDLEEWSPRFGIGSEPTNDPGDGPSWDELIAAWRATHDVADEVGREASVALLNKPNPIERRRDTLPTTGDMAGFIFSSHEAVHLGQLSAWRRVQGRPRLF
ncbi:MAG: DinB family protein [Planctomycetota bacterium]